MTALRTARERARADVTAEILAAAGAQLADVGAAGLSLRAVARELGMASSALYRYFATREALLTALIVAAYDDLGEAVEQASAPRPDRSARQRLTALACAARAWAADHPHEYFLIFGSPVPGFAADPATTNTPGSRVPRAVVAVVADGCAGGEDELPAALAQQAARLAGQLRPWFGARDDVTASVLVRAAGAWTALFGLIGFEASGQLRGSFDPADALFDHQVARIADQAGLP